MNHSNSSHYFVNLILTILALLLCCCEFGLDRDATVKANPGALILLEQKLMDLPDAIDIQERSQTAVLKFGRYHAEQLKFKVLRSGKDLAGEWQYIQLEGRGSRFNGLKLAITMKPGYAWVRDARLTGDLQIIYRQGP